MLRKTAFLIIFLSISFNCFAGGESETSRWCREHMITGFKINMEASTHYRNMENTGDCFGTVTVTWNEAPFSGGLLNFAITFFEFYSLDLYKKDSDGVYKSVTGGTTISNRTTTSYTFFDFESGSYQLRIAGNYGGYFVGRAWGVRTNYSEVTFIVDRTPPDSPDSPTINGYSVGSVYYTKENSLKDGLPGHVTLNWNAVKDYGFFRNDDKTASGLAGYRIYQQSVLDPLLTVNALATTAQLKLDEGQYILHVKAFDNLSVVEQSGLESKDTRPATIVVDRSGPGKIDELRFDTASGHEPGSPIFASVNSRIDWDVETDYPAGFTAGIQNGIGTDKYMISLLNNISGASNQIQTRNDYYDIPSGMDAGSYTISVRGIDFLGNEGLWSDPKTFYIDKIAPPSPDIAGISINDVNARKEISGNIVTFNTSFKNPVLSFAAVSEGDEDYQSGMGSYEIVNTVTNLSQAGTVQGTLVTISLTGLENGDNSFRIYAKDRAGNRSLPVNVRISVSQLPAATFPVPCYVLENGTYFLIWNAPVSSESLIQISYYKVISGLSGMDAPGMNDFTALSELHERKASLEGKPRGAKLAVYVLSVDVNGSSSIASTTFTLPPDITGGEDPYIITTDEYWGPGEKIIGRPVIVREGASLYILDNTQVKVQGSGAVYLRVEGRMIANGGSTGISFEGLSGGTMAWKGIIGSGEVELSGVRIENAERGLTILPGSAVSIENSTFISSRVGVHAGAAAVINGCLFEQNEWYGVKEDFSGPPNRPTLTGCVFRENGYDYYHKDMRNITMDQLNGLPGNSGNERGE